MSAVNNETGNEQGSCSGYKEEVKEIRIEGSNYEVKCISPVSLVFHTLLKQFQVLFFYISGF